MMMSFKRLGTAAMIVALAFDLRAATVKKADDTTVTGPLLALEKNAIVLEVEANGKKQRSTIALEDIVELTVDATVDVPKTRVQTQSTTQKTAPAPAAAVKGPAMDSLFDGKSLKNWEGKEGLWKVENGVIVGKAGEEARSNRPTYLIYNGGQYADFELHYKAKVTGGRPNSSGMQFRSQVREQGGEKEPFGYQQDLGVPAGMSGGIVDNGNNSGNGPVKASPGENVTYTSEGQRQVATLDKTAEQLNATFKADDWNDCVIVAKGTRIVSLINGEVFAVINNESGSGMASGTLGVQLSTRTDCEVRLKDIFIRKLGASDMPSVGAQFFGGKDAVVAKPATTANPSEPQKLFDGKTLNGWAGDPKFWSTRDGGIAGVVKPQDTETVSTYLAWQGGALTDFDLSFRYKITNGYSGSSGLFFHAKVVDAAKFEVTGYQVNLGSDPSMSGTLWHGLPNTGGRGMLGGIGEKVVVKAGGARDVTNLSKTRDEIVASIKTDDWNDAQISVHGNHIGVTINGVVVTDVTDEAMSDALKSGTIAFQLDRQKRVIAQFKDIELRGSASGSSTPASNDARWTIRLSNGDQVTGKLTGWDEQNLTLEAAAGTLSFPVKQVREIWRGSDAEVAKARAAAKQQAQVTEDVAFARQKDQQVVSVNGLALGASSNGTVKFRFRDQEREILPDKFVGVILAAAGEVNVAADDTLRQVLMLTGGDAVSGQWSAFENGNITLVTAWGTSLKVPIQQVEKIRTQNGRLTYLSDLAPASVEQTPYFDRLIPFRTDTALNGETIKLSDGLHTKGISVHSRTVLKYDIGRKYDRFRAKVGFQQPDGKIGRATIRVLGDGDKVLHEIADARGDQPPADLDLPIAGVSRLTLEVDFGADQDVGDRVAWAEARLLRAGAGPVR